MTKNGSWWIKVIYLVTGDHPTLGRPDKDFVSDCLGAKKYADELKAVGYENVKITRRFRRFERTL